MKFSDFLTKWNGRYIDFDGAYGNQCFDLFHQYNVDVLGLADGRIMAAPGAKDIYDNFNNLFGHEFFEKIPNTPENVPLEGDIMIWGTGTWGHVAVFVEGDVNSFRSFDQNYPTGSPCHIQNHTYSGVSGWIRFKTASIPVSPALEACQTSLADEIKKKNDNWNWGNELSNEVDGLKSQITHYTNYEKQLASTLNCSVDEAVILGEITKSISANDQLTQCNKDNQNLKTTEANLTTDLAQEKERADNAILTNQGLSTSLQEATGKVTDLTTQLSQSKQTYKPLFKLFGLTICQEV